MSRGLYRAKPVSGGEMVKGYYAVIVVDSIVYHFIIPATASGGIDHLTAARTIEGMVEVIKSTVGQATGETGKGDEPLFAGDRVRCVFENGLKSTGYIDFWKGAFRIVGDDGSFDWLHKYTDRLDEYKPEVVGTIHDKEPEDV